MTIWTAFEPRRGVVEVEVFLSTFLRIFLYREGSKICLHFHHPLGCEKGRCHSQGRIYRPNLLRDGSENRSYSGRSTANRHYSRVFLGEHWISHPTSPVI